MTVFRLRNLVQWAVGKTLTSTYDPPEVHDPSPENMVSDTLYLAEHHLYGSSRLGVKQYTEDMYYTVYDSDDTTLLQRRDWYSYMQDDWMQKNKAAAYIHDVYSVSLDSASSLNRIGTKQYELTDHLGNVLVTLLDRRTGIGNAGGFYTGWRADVHSVSDYYPFGMQMTARTAGSGSRYGYNGMEQDNEVKGIGNSYDFGARMYDSRIARWTALDPLAAKYPSLSPYNFVANNPLMFIDPDGRKIRGATKKDAEKFHNHINTTFADEKFNSFRKLIKRGKKNNSAQFDVISDKDLEEALVGLSERESALVKLYVDVINDEKTVEVQYINLEYELNKQQSKEIEEYLISLDEPEIAEDIKSPIIKNKIVDNPDGTKSKMNYTELGYTGSSIKILAGGGYTIKTSFGARAYIIENEIDFNITEGHEVIGHGRPILKGYNHLMNNTHAIRTDNLIREILGRGDFRDGADHGNGVAIENPRDLPK